MLQVIGAVGFMDHRLEIPSDVDPQWASMIESCWERYIYITILQASEGVPNSRFPIPLNQLSPLCSEPQRRPSFRELLERLQGLQKQYTVQAQTERKAAGKGARKASVKDDG